MSRLLFWIVLVLVVLYAIRVKLKNEMPRPRQPVPPPGPGRRVTGEVEDMACCAHCGVYFPASEAVSIGARAYCSAAHAAQAGA